MNDDHYAELRAAVERLPANEVNYKWVDIFGMKEAIEKLDLDATCIYANVIIAARRLVGATAENSTRPFIVIGRTVVPIASVEFIRWNPGEQALSLHLTSGMVLQAPIGHDNDAVKVFEDMGYGPWVPSLLSDLRGG